MWNETKEDSFAQLLILNGTMSGRSYEITGAVTMIGRSPESHIQVNDPSVSRTHLKIRKDGNRIYIEDLQSQNGTWVHGRRIDPGNEVEVEYGVSIAIGKVFFRLAEIDQQFGLITQHSIHLSIMDGSEGVSPFYKDRRVTDRGKLELILDVSTLMMQSLEISVLCEKILASLFGCLKRIDSGVILLIDEEMGEINEGAARSRENTSAEVSYSRTVVSKVIREGRAVIMSDLSKEDRKDLSESMEMMRVKSVMCVPLISKGGTRGVIYLHSVNVPHGFREDDLYLITCLSTPAALAIENALLYSRSRRMQEALGQSEEKYRLLVDNANDAILIVQDGLIRFLNPCAALMYGYSETRLNSVPFMDLFHPEDAREALEMQGRVLSGKGRKGAYSLRGVTAKGAVLWAEISSVRILWDNAPAVLNILRDVTHQKRLEERAIHSQKMEAVGTLAAGVAHEFNNIFMGIQGNTSLLLLDIGQNNPHNRKLRNIEKYVRRGAGLTQQLLGFASEGRYEAKTISPNDLVARSSEIFNRSKPGIRMQRVLQRSVWNVNADQRQMEQLLVNLYSNSWDAMPEGGDLYLETRNVQLQEEEAAPFGATAGRYVLISVRDTGAGIEEAILGRVFEPFFTTKEIGKGVGLGLAAVYGIARSHGGFVEIKSRRGAGTTIMIYLPASIEDGAKENEPTDILRGSETLLLVENEDLLEEAREVLESLGYRVLLSSTEETALSIFRKKATEIDLVILDPEICSRGEGNFREELMEIDPEAKLLLSGSHESGEAATQSHYLEKNSDISELSHIIREKLDV